MPSDETPLWRGFIDLVGDPMGTSPVFMCEFRSRMRWPWAHWLLFVYTALLYAAGVCFLYRYAGAELADVQGDVTSRIHQGGTYFALGLFAVQLLMVSAMAPLLAAGSFAGERARRRLVFLLLTPLPSARIVAGKLHFVLAYLALLLLASMPLCAVSSLFGGLSPGDLLSGYALLLAYAVMLSAFGLFVSARTAHGSRAALLGYLGAAAAAFLFPWLLLPAAGLYRLVVSRDPAIFALIAEGVPIPLAALSSALLFLLVASWLIRETISALDCERHLWGTYPPPLPWHAGDASAPPASVIPSRLKRAPAPEPPPPRPPSHLADRSPSTRRW